MSGKHIVVTVHGIRTYGEWQRRFAALFPQDSAIQFHHFEYGFFSAAAFYFPFIRSFVVRRFRHELRALVARHQPERIDLIGHSFGTYIIAEALRGLHPDEPIKIHTVILAGSVLRSTFRWSDLIPLRVKRVVNDCGSKDGVLLLSQFGVLGTGMAGRIGFMGMNGPEFANRYSSCGHSGYFQDPDGRATDAFMRENWMPLIGSNAPIQAFDHRETPTALRGFWIWVCNNLEPTKLAIVFGPILLALFWTGTLYLKANATTNRVAKVVDLGTIMRDRVPPEAAPALDTVRHALNVPLTRTNILWVDDTPTNNRNERELLATFGFCFEMAHSTSKAVQTLEETPDKFSLVISDFRRDNDPQAYRAGGDTRSGYLLLEQLRDKGISIPFIFYSANSTKAHDEEARRRTAFAQVNSPFDLVLKVFTAVPPREARGIQLINDLLSPCRVH